MKNIQFSPPFIDEEIITEVSNTLRSGWITTGPKTKLFESKIAKYIGVEKVLGVNSWTAGAEMILKWFGLEKGDEVIIPAYTYCATANIIIHCGAKPVMVDVKDDFCISIDEITKAITPQTKAIISVDLGGFPVNYNEILKLINEKEIREIFNPSNSQQEKLGRILFLSDAAHSFGAKYNGDMVGLIPDFTVFSFHAVKNLTTAEGGAICINLPKPFNNVEIYNYLNCLSLHGQNKDALSKTQIGGWEYDVLDAGFKCNMTDVLASIGLIQLKSYESQNLKRRKEIFFKYSQIFKDYSWSLIPTYFTSLKESSYHLYLLRIKEITLKQRNEIIKRIFEKGVSVNVHYKPLPLLSFYKNSGYNIDDYPVSNELWESEISLPVHLSLTDEDIETIIKSVIESYNETINN